MKIYHFLEVFSHLFLAEIKTSMGPNASETLLDVVLYILHPLTLVSKRGLAFLVDYF